MDGWMDGWMVVFDDEKNSFKARTLGIYR